MLEELAKVLGKEAIKKFGDWFIQKLSGNKKAVEADSIPNRFIRLFEKHGVHRNQIPRFFGHGLSLADVANSDVLLAKLTPEILQAVSELFAVRMEWIECVDNQIYQTHNFYKRPEDYNETGFSEDIINLGILTNGCTILEIISMVLMKAYLEKPAHWIDGYTAFLISNSYLKMNIRNM